MLTVYEWFSLVNDNNLRKHLLKKLKENSASKDHECYSFSQAIQGAFPWDSDFKRYVDLHNHPPELRNAMIYKIKKFLKEIK